MIGRFSGKTALVVGGSSGIGWKIASDLADCRARIIIVSRSKKKQEEISDSIADAEFIACDIGSPEGYRALVDRVEKTHKKIDYLIFSAGIYKELSLTDTSEQVWDEMIGTNLKSAFFIIKSLLGLLKEGQGRGIVLISSVLGSFGARDTSAYSISKAGIISLTKSLAVELADFGIRINCISPSFVDTEMVRSLLEDKSVKDAIVSKHPLGRIGSPRDISNLALFLLSDLSDWITGQNFLMDGGRSIQI